ncbi:MAG: peptide chain release factor-like protein [Phycisphaerales bacterium]|nr:peptide chain release factor-like protein [Phycisphaerales bacterium]
MDFLEHLDRPVERPIHPAALSKDELLKECTITRGRASGPGGQHRNKVETHITVIHDPSGIEAQAGERRLAKENQSVAIRRLRLKLAMGVRVEVPPGDIRSELWRRRCVKNRIVCNPKHEDYPSMLAEVFDLIDDSGFDIKPAAIRLECSSTQLLRFVADHPPAFEQLNQSREDRGLRRLKP